MPSLKCVVSAVLFCTAIVFFATSANADTTYTYTGNRLTNFIEESCPVQSDPRVCPPVNYCPPICSMDAAITFSTPLGDNLKNVFVMPKNFKFFVPGFPEATQTPANSLPLEGPLGNFPGAFNFSTNASGQIVNWNIFVQGEFEGFFNYDTENMSASCPKNHAPRHFYRFADRRAKCALFADDNVFGYAGEGLSSNMDDPGKWTVSTTGTNVPEPASGTLLIAGLVGLAGLALKKAF